MYLCISWIIKCLIIIDARRKREGCCNYWLLTPRCRVLPEQLTGLQLVKKFPAFHGTRRFITALTNARHLSLSWASPIQSIYPHPTSWRSILILSSHLRLGLPSGLPQVLETGINAHNVFAYPVPTSQRIQWASFRRCNRWMLCGGVCVKNRRHHVQKCCVDKLQNFVLHLVVHTVTTRIITGRFLSWRV